MPSFSFEIKAIPPFRLDYTVWALRRRSHNSVDLWDGKYYKRVLVIRNKALELSISQPNVNDETLLVSVTGSERSNELQSEISTCHNEDITYPASKRVAEEKESGL